MADRNDIRIQNCNIDWAGGFTLYLNGAARDLTGATFKANIRVNEADADPVATLSTDDNTIALSGTPTDGRVFLKVPSGTLDPGPYVYDVRMTIDDAEELVWVGSINVQLGVTRDA